MRKRIIACVLACAMLLLGTGYAYWTDTIDLTTSATTGDLQVKFTGAVDLDKNNFVATGDTNLPESAYDEIDNDAELVDDDSVTFNVDQLYPGHYETFKATAVNAGSVAAELGKINIEDLNQDTTQIADMVGIAIDVQASYTTKHWLFPWISIPHLNDIDAALSADFDPEDTFQIGNVVFARLSALEDITVLDNVKNILYLTNGSSMNFKVCIGMDPDATGDYTTGNSDIAPASTNLDSNTENKDVSVRLDLVWDQYNE